MKISSNNIQVKKTARYYTNEIEPGNVEAVWFLLHGYGQLAENFIKKFPILENGKNYLAAPEALSRFYLDNGYGKTGASWMTKEDRENEIADYTGYLSAIYNNILKELNGRKIKLNVVGFSQATSTVCRWLQRSGIKADNLILWGGFLPDDFNLEKWNEAFDSLLIVAGNKDEFVPMYKFTEGQKLLDKYAVKYDMHIYDGGHEMKEKNISEVFALY
jgi:predicted esterase